MAQNAGDSLSAVSDDKCSLVAHQTSSPKRNGVRVGGSGEGRSALRRRKNVDVRYIGSEEVEAVKNRYMACRTVLNIESKGVADPEEARIDRVVAAVPEDEEEEGEGEVDCYYEAGQVLNLAWRR